MLKKVLNLFLLIAYNKDISINEVIFILFQKSILI